MLTTAEKQENRRRAKTFDQLLELYGTLGGDADSPQDILADMRHWCDWKRRSYAQIDRLAHDHYTAEKVGEQ